MRTTLFVGLLTLILAFFTFTSSNVHKTEITPTPTPTPELIDCTIGDNSFTLPADICQSIKKDIGTQRQSDSTKVSQIITYLNGQLHPTPSINGDNGTNLNTQVNNILNRIPNYSDKMNAAYNIAIVLMNKMKQDLEYTKELEKQIDFYQKYYLHIDGGAGNGACSGHDGVDCAAGKGNVGQVICNDGWKGSSVYYFNVDECLSYYVNITTK